MATRSMGVSLNAMETQRFGGGGFGIEITPLVKTTLIALVSIYILELVLAEWAGLPIFEWFAMWPVGQGLWKPWQPVTALLINQPSPLGAFLEWLVLLFFMGTCEKLLGTQKLLQAILFACATAVLATTLLDVAGLLTSSRPYMGLRPVLSALLVVFGLSIPHARILLFFVLPIKAIWVAWGTGLMALLYFLSGRDLYSAMSLFGWVGAWIWMNGGTGFFKRFMLKRKQKELEKQLSRFTVHEGGRGNDDEYIH